MMSQDSSKKDEKDLPQKNPIANVNCEILLLLRFQFIILSSENLKILGSLRGLLKILCLI